MTTIKAANADAELAWQTVKRVHIPADTRRTLATYWPGETFACWAEGDARALLQQLAEDIYRLRLRRWTRRTLRRHHFDETAERLHHRITRAIQHSIAVHRISPEDFYLAAQTAVGGEPPTGTVLQLQRITRWLLATCPPNASAKNGANATGHAFAAPPQTEPASACHQ